MRIIGGKYGSRRINVKIPDNVRPTTDRVRESIFNILNNLIDFQDLKVLDLFSGTGAFGFEAISRGSAYCHFVEKNRRTSELIHSIANSLEIPKNEYGISNGDAVKFLQSDNERHNLSFNLIFADPPYDNDIYTQLLEELSISNILSPNFLAVIEYRTINKLNIPDVFNIISERTFGDTSFKFIELKK